MEQTHQMASGVYPWRTGYDSVSPPLVITQFHNLMWLADRWEVEEEVQEMWALAGIKNKQTNKWKTQTFLHATQIPSCVKLEKLRDV